MKDEDLIRKWLAKMPDDESVEVVRRVLVHFFGDDSVCPNTGDSHQLRIKHPALRNMPACAPYGHLSIPVRGGQRVRGCYVKRVAEAVEWLKEATEGEKGK